MASTIITYDQWSRAAKRAEKKNLKEKGESLSWVSISSKCNNYILEVQPDRRVIIMIVKEGWREALKKAGE